MVQFLELLRMTNTLKGLNTCEVCKKVMPSNDLYSHLEIVHKYSQERIAVVKDEIRREGIAIRNILPVMCPICEERFEGHDDLANHCSAVHSKDGAGGEAQDYSLLSLRFSKIEEFEVGSHCNIARLSACRMFVGGERLLLSIKRVDQLLSLVITFHFHRSVLIDVNI